MAQDMELLTRAFQSFLARHDLGGAHPARLIIVARDIPEQHRILMAMRKEFPDNSATFAQAFLNPSLDRETALINGVRVSVRVPREAVPL